jgi:hypothetical protein
VVSNTATPDAAWLNCAYNAAAHWDAFIGRDRLSRAHSFTRALQSLGADVALRVFPNAGHTLTDAMLIAGCDALAGAEIRS